MLCYNIPVVLEELTMKEVLQEKAHFDESLIFDIASPENTNAIALIGQALSAPVRVQILSLINKRAMLASEIAAALDLPLSSTMFHLKILENAALIKKESSPGIKKSRHYYTFVVPKFLTIKMREVDGLAHTKRPPYICELNIGDYIDAVLSPSCGIATESKHIMENNPKQAFISGRHDAQIIWSHTYGSLTYAIPNDFAAEGALSEICISLEICSEAMGYNNDFPSDIVFSINGIELCTFTSPGDFGDRYGRYTPPWWFPESTKYGILANISVRNSGVFLNEILTNKKVCLSDLNLSDGNRLTFSIEVKKDATHAGGFNIFGEKFGDYNQGIVFTAIYE